VDARVAEFYDLTSEYEFDVWSEWRGGFRPFGSALAAIFSRRLQQLNVPLSPLDTSQGISTAVIRLVDYTGAVVQTAWVREIIASERTLYAGSYSLCRVPGFDGPCVKVAFPLPNGSANVIMQPEFAPDGSFTVRSSGRSFGDPGFYFFVQAGQGRGWSRYLKALKEDIRVDIDPRGHLRADHDLRIWGATFLRLHYRIRRSVTLYLVRGCSRAARGRESTPHSAFHNTAGSIGQVPSRAGPEPRSSACGRIGLSARRAQISQRRPSSSKVVLTESLETL
jgi:hypothetical protein